MEMGRKTLMSNAHRDRAPWQGLLWSCRNLHTNTVSFVSTTFLQHKCLPSPPHPYSPTTSILNILTEGMAKQINKDLASASGKLPLQVPIFMVARLELVGLSFHGNCGCGGCTLFPGPGNRLQAWLSLSAGRPRLSLHEAWAVAEGVAAGQWEGLLVLLTLLRGVAGKRLCPRHLRCAQAMTCGEYERCIREASQGSMLGFEAPCKAGLGCPSTKSWCSVCLLQLPVVPWEQIYPTGAGKEGFGSSCITCGQQITRWGRRSPDPTQMPFRLRFYIQVAEYHIYIFYTL